MELDRITRCDRSDHTHHSLDEARCCWRLEQVLDAVTANHLAGKPYTWELRSRLQDAAQALTLAEVKADLA